MSCYKENVSCIEMQIEQLRSDLIKCGMEKGFTHPTTIELSQKLDKMLNKLRRL